MKIRNKTSEPKYLRSYGRQVLVEPFQIVDLEKVHFDERSFEIYAQELGVKKDSSDSPNESYLETRNISGEENKSGRMPVDVDNQHPPVKEKKNSLKRTSKKEVNKHGKSK